MSSIVKTWISTKLGEQTSRSNPQLLPHHDSLVNASKAVEDIPGTGDKIVSFLSVLKKAP